MIISFLRALLSGWMSPRRLAMVWLGLASGMFQSVNAQNQTADPKADEAPQAELATIPVDALPQQTEAETQSTGAQLETVIVTAQKRSDPLQDVPASVTAFTAKDLERISFNDVSDLVAYVPALSVGTNVSPLSTSFRLRNVGKFSAIPSFEPAVGLFIDGAFRARSGLGLGDIVDVTSVEVLKGPQSTLYGKNVSAGVISIATEGPTESFEAMTEASVGNYNLRQFKGYVSGPLLGGLKGRLSGIYTKSGPFMKNLVGVDHDDRGSKAVRGQLAYDFSNGLSSRLIVGYVDKDLHPKQGDTFASDANIEIIRNAGGQVTNNNPRDGIVEYDDFNRFTLTATDVIFNNTYKAENWSLTSISSYDEYDALSALRDAEQMSLSTAIYDDTQIGSNISQELRLDTRVTDRVKFLGGLFLLKSHFRQGDPNRPEFVLEDQVEELGNSIASYIAAHPEGQADGAPGLPVTPTIPIVPGMPLPLIGVEGDQGNFLAILNTRAYGIFSKIDIELTDALDVSLGVRYSAERKAGSLVQSYTLSPLGCVPPVNANFICAVTPQGNDFAKTRTFSGLTGAFQASYHFTKNFMVYGTLSNGFKSGGYSLQNGTAPADFRPYGSERIINVDAGFKSEFFKKRVRINAAVFRTRYKDYQEASYRGLFFVVNSAESVSVTGMELDTEFLLAKSLTASLGLQYVDSKYDTYTSGQCFYGRTPDNDRGQCDLSGQKLPTAATVKGLASLEWERRLGQGKFYSRGDYSHTGKANSSSELDPRFNQPALGLINVKLGWRTSQADVSVGAKNLTDQKYVDQSANANVLTPIDTAVGSPVGSYQNYVGTPREIELSLKLTF